MILDEENIYCLSSTETFSSSFPEKVSMSLDTQNFFSWINQDPYLR